VPDPDPRAPAKRSEEEKRAVQGTVRIQDLGEEVHLWIEQRVPWPVALKILEALKAPEQPGRRE
jgi:hypothetical protein